MRIIQKKAKYTPPPPKKALVKVPSFSDVDTLITSARVFEKHGKIHIDYKCPKGRVRFTTGKVYTKRTYTQINRDVYALALDHFLSSNDVSDGKIYFEDIGLKALEEDSGTRQNDTQLDYMNIYINHVEPYFRGLLLEDINVSTIKAWCNTLLTTIDLSKSRYRVYHRVLGFVMKYAYLNNLIEKDLMSLVPIKSKQFKITNVDNSQKYYTAGEAKLIMDNATGWFKVFITTLFNTGIRTGEALALKWEDIDFKNSVITIRRSVRKGYIKETTKTGVNRKIDLNTPLGIILLAYRDSEHFNPMWLFPNPATGWVYNEPKSIIRWKFKPLLESLNIPYRTLYATRHSFASSAVQNGIPITYVQRQLGHSKISTTDCYIKHTLLSKDGRDIRADSLYDC